MKIHALLLMMALDVCVAAAAIAESPKVPADWLVNPTSFKSNVTFDGVKHELVLENGLTSRTLRVTPNAATVDYRNLVTGEQMLRAVGPEARVTLDGTEYDIGGLEGQPIQNYIMADQIDAFYSDPAAYRFADWKEEPIVARFPWKKRPEWMSSDLPWPAAGKSVVLKFVPPAESPSKMTGKLPLPHSECVAVRAGTCSPCNRAHAIRPP